jgi:hypothetical protein
LKFGSDSLNEKPSVENKNPYQRNPPNQDQKTNGENSKKNNIVNNNQGLDETNAKKDPNAKNGIGQKSKENKNKQVKGSEGNTRIPVDIKDLRWKTATQTSSSSSSVNEKTHLPPGLNVLII